MHVTIAPRMKDTHVKEFTDKESLGCTFGPVLCVKRILILSHLRKDGIMTEIMKTK